MMKSFACWICALAICCLVPNADATAGQADERTQTLVVGVVSSDPKSRIVRLEAMARYLAERLHDVGIRGGATIVAQDNTEMARLLGEGAVDFFSETVFAGLYLEEAAGAEFLLREWKKGKSEYRTVFFARRDSGIQSIQDLRGKKIAFEDRGSTSAFLLPLAILRDHGLDAKEIPSRAQAPVDGVGYSFANKEVNIAAWVARGIAQAGAFSNGDWETVERTPTPLKTGLFVFHKSAPVMRSAGLVRGGLRPDLKARIKQVLLTMHRDSTGQDVLKFYDKVARYDEISGDSLGRLEQARQLYRLVADEVR